MFSNEIQKKTTLVRIEEIQKEFDTTQFGKLKQQLSTTDEIETKEEPLKKNEHLDWVVYFKPFMFVKFFIYHLMSFIFGIFSPLFIVIFEGKYVPINMQFVIFKIKRPN